MMTINLLTNRKVPEEFFKELRMVSWEPFLKGKFFKRGTFVKRKFFDEELFFEEEPFVEERLF